MSDSLSDSSLAGDKGLRSSLRSQAGRYSQQHRYSLDADMEHKDILSDADFLDTDSHSGEHSLSPELQIQRLTAQLTAAYNRIAALEEQLLSKRIAH
ncbi:hypothetical protein ACQ4M4_03315 [Leptolyngbya sp. AN02str]|uniref:hypothetical protein n=1 Tax=Leptolyngbya sp. AN02str TaxID=3423363 RepID=UPI003D322E63